MGIVELDSRLIGEGLPIEIDALEARDDVLHRGRGEEIFLLQAEDFAHG